MRDIIYVYKSQPRSEELLWSVRSCRNIEHGRIIVVGDHPNVAGVEHSKPPVNRWSMLSPVHDVINKLYHATTLDITDDFILMNDDFFCLEPTDIPTAHRGTLDHHIEGRNLNDNYSKQLKKTRDFLISQGIKDPLSYELHIPMVFNKEKLIKLLDDIVPQISHASPMLIRSLYGNIYKIGGEQMSDVKTIDDHTGLTFLSTNEKTFAGERGDYIRSMLD